MNRNMKLLTLMLERKISSTALAKMADVGRSTIHRMKEGRSVPEYPTLVKIAEALGVEVKEII